MDTQQIINAWKTHRADPQITPDLPDNVMAQIHDYRQKKAVPLPNVADFAENLFRRPLAKAAVAAAAVLGGFFRLGLTYYIILS